MSYNWGPNYLVPSPSLKTYEGSVRLRESFDSDTLARELETLKITGYVTRVNNPWYYRKKNTSTWIMIGESSDQAENFPVTWDTTKLDNGRYEILGLMHVTVKSGDQDKTIARQNVVEVTVKN